MYVVCFYWEGERWQEKKKLEGTFVNHLKRVGTVSHSLASKYINNLYKGVKRFASEEFKFICFTNLDKLDLDENIEKRDLPIYSKKGVLPRLYMFSKDAGLFGHQVLCLDLDLVITGSLKDIMGYKGHFCTRKSFTSNELDGDIMSFKADEKTEKIFWMPFINNIEKAETITQGRERYWVRHVAKDIADCWKNIAPGQVVSYKRHARRWDKVPEKVSIISFHGKPRPHQVNNKWIQKYWN
jgi:hypothetical protein